MKTHNEYKKKHVETERFSLQNYSNYVLRLMQQGMKETQ